MIVVETKRLTVRHLEMSDVEAMSNVFGDPEVMYFGESVKSEQWVRDWTGQNLSSKLDAAPWVVDEKNSGETIGYCGLFHYPDICGQPETELGYRLARQYWGHGYATEAALSVKNYAFNSLGISRLIALIDPGNLASINVAEKTGFRYEKEVMLEGYTHPDHVYSISHAASA